jgi:two-component system LytT family response regulator
MIRRVLVVDDEPLAREHLTELVRAVAPRVEVREAGDGEAALDSIHAFAPDVVFLDVQMPACDGFEVIAAIGVERMPLTVFVTAFDRHAIHAFAVSAVDYLLKPFDAERFREAWVRTETRHALNGVLAESQRLASLLASIATAGRAMTPFAVPPARAFVDRLIVTHKQRTFIVKLADVEWIEAAGNYVLLHTSSAEHKVRERLSALEERLDPDRFVRIHRRVVVSLDAIRELQPWFGGDQVLILRNGRQLRVSRTFRRRVARRLAGTG